MRKSRGSFYFYLIAMAMIGLGTAASVLADDTASSAFNPNAAFSDLIPPPCVPDESTPCPQQLIQYTEKMLKNKKWFFFFGDGDSAKQVCQTAYLENNALSAMDVSKIFNSFEETAFPEKEQLKRLLYYDKDRCLKDHYEVETDSGSRHLSPLSFQRFATVNFYYLTFRMASAYTERLRELADINSMMGQPLLDPSQCNQTDSSIIEYIPEAQRWCDALLFCEPNEHFEKMSAQTFEALEKLNEWNQIADSLENKLRPITNELSRIQSLVERYTQIAENNPIYFEKNIKPKLAKLFERQSVLVKKRDEIQAELEPAKKMIALIHTSAPWIDLAELNGRKKYSLSETKSALQSYYQKRKNQIKADLSNISNAVKCLHYPSSFANVNPAYCESTIDEVLSHYPSNRNKWTKLNNKGAPFTLQGNPVAAGNIATDLMNAAECSADVQHKNDEFQKLSDEFAIDELLVLPGAAVSFISKVKQLTGVAKIMGAASKAAQVIDFGRGVNFALDSCRESLHMTGPTLSNYTPQSGPSCPSDQSIPGAQESSDLQSCLLSVLLSVGPDTLRAIPSVVRKIKSVRRSHFIEELATPATTRPRSLMTKNEAIQEMNDYVRTFSPRTSPGKNIRIDNEAFIRNIPETGDPSRIFVATELRGLKKINDTFGKEFGTAIKNHFDQIFMEKLRRSGLAQYLKEKAATYLDYKSLLNDLDWDKIRRLGKEKETLTLLNSVFSESKVEFGRFIRGNPHLSELTESLPTNLQNPEHWFLGGIGHHPDHSLIAARLQRNADASSQYSLLPYMPGSAEFGRGAQGLLTKQLSHFEEIDSQIQNIAKTQSKAFDQISGQYIPKSEVFDVIRKADRTHPQWQLNVRDEITRRIGANLSESEMRQIIKYFDQLDDTIALGPYLRDRVPLQFEKAREGVFTLDISGQGAEGLHQNAQNMIPVLKNMRSGQTGEAIQLADQALRSARAAERSVTTQMNQTREMIKDAFDRLSEKRRLQGDFSPIHVAASGDDLFAALRDLSPDEMSFILREIHSDLLKVGIKPGRVRTVTLATQFQSGEQIPRALKGPLASIGDDLSKKVSSELINLKDLSPELKRAIQSQDVPIHIHFIPSNANGGGVVQIITDKSLSHEQALQVGRSAVEQIFPSASHRPRIEHTTF